MNLVGRGGCRLPSGIELALDALLRLLWLDTRYQVLDGERTLTLFSPWPLQPGGVLAALPTLVNLC